MLREFRLRLLVWRQGRKGRRDQRRLRDLTGERFITFG